MSQERSVLAAALAGAGLAVLLGVPSLGLLAFKWSERMAVKKSPGWDQVPVVVLATDVKAGEALSMENLSQRSLPSRFVDSAAVRPDQAAEVVGRTLKAGQLMGDTVFRANLEPAPGAACAEAIAATLKVRTTPPSPALADVLKAVSAQR
jgi:Flp pilus assembly protein CpaB